MLRSTVLSVLLVALFATTSQAQAPGDSVAAVVPVASSAPATPVDAVSVTGSPAAPSTPPSPTAATGVVISSEPLDPIDKDPGGFLQTIIQAVHDKNWSYVVGAVLMFLVWIVRKYFWASLPTAYVPWLAAGLGVIVDVSLSLIANVIWWKAILSGLTSGAAAIALWELVFKHLLGTKDEEKAAGKPA